MFPKSYLIVKQKEKKKKTSENTSGMFPLGYLFDGFALASCSHIPSPQAVFKFLFRELGRSFICKKY